MRMFDKIVKLIKRAAGGPQRRSQLDVVRRSNAPLAGPIADGLDEAMALQLTSTEAAWVDKIEALRRKLAASQESVTMIDYGARTKDGA
ncbi:MAG: hypothetical protein ACRDD1_19810, partial [Planctomycetia bacterium]